jgi:hypothetical protein
MEAGRNLPLPWERSFRHENVFVYPHPAGAHDRAGRCPVIGALITLIIYILVVGILVWLVLWIVDSIPLPEPFNRIIRILVIVVAVLIVILLLLQLAGGAGNLSLPKL